MAVATEIKAPEFPCEARREAKYYNDTPETDKQCSRRARYVVDGQKLCLRHAEIRALQILMTSPTSIS